MLGERGRSSGKVIGRDPTQVQQRMGTPLLLIILIQFDSIRFDCFQTIVALVTFLPSVVTTHLSHA